MPQTSKTTLPSKIHRNAHIANLAISGMTSKQIAAQPGIDISDSMVRRVLNDKQCKDILDHVMRVNISHAKGINKQFLQMCYPDKDGNVDRKVQLDAIKQYQKNVGIAPSHATSLFIQNINNDNRQLITSDVESLFKLLSCQAASDEDVIDAELLP